MTVRSDPDPLVKYRLTDYTLACRKLATCFKVGGHYFLENALIHRQLIASD